MSLTIGRLKEFLNEYPDNLEVTTEQGQPIVHIVNMGRRLIISPTKPIGYCNRTGKYVYPSLVEGYVGYSPELDEDLENWEFSPLPENKSEECK